MNVESWERNYRSSHSQIFFKISDLKNFANFRGKRLCWSLFLIKLLVWTLATLLRRDSNTGAMRKKLQKQSFADILQNRCSQKLCEFHRKIPVFEYFFNNVAGLKTCSFIKKRLQHSCFPVKFVKFLIIPFLQNTFGGYFWNLTYASAAILLHIRIENLNWNESHEQKTINIFMLRLPIYYILK